MNVCINSLMLLLSVLCSFVVSIADFNEVVDSITGATSVIETFVEDIVNNAIHEVESGFDEVESTLAGLPDKVLELLIEKMPFDLSMLDDAAVRELALTLKTCFGNMALMNALGNLVDDIDIDPISTLFDVTESAADVGLLVMALPLSQNPFTKSIFEEFCLSFVPKIVEIAQELDDATSSVTMEVGRASDYDGECMKDVDGVFCMAATVESPVDVEGNEYYKEGVSAWPHYIENIRKKVDNNVAMELKRAKLSLATVNDYIEQTANAFQSCAPFPPCIIIGAVLFGTRSYTGLAERVIDIALEVGDMHDAEIEWATTTAIHENSESVINNQLALRDMIAQLEGDLAAAVSDSQPMVPGMYPTNMAQLVICALVLSMVIGLVMGIVIGKLIWSKQGYQPVKFAAESEDDAMAVLKE